MGDLLKGKVAVVTGSGQGIGRAIAIELARQGAKVVTNNRKPGGTQGPDMLTEKMINSMDPAQKEWVLKQYQNFAGDAESTAKAIKEEGGEATAFYADIADFEAAKALIEKAVTTYGSIDILVNVAGTFGFSPIEKMSREMWDKVTAVKPGGYFNTIRSALPYMIEKKWGRIINCTSRAFWGDVIKHAEYCAANAGVVGLTRAVAIEMYEHGITCNAFSPFARTRAAVDLEKYDTVVEDGNKALLNADFAIPFEATPDPENLAPFICYLASEHAANISGTIFELAGNSISMYSEPRITKTVFKEGGRWMVEEIAEKAPFMLFRDYEGLSRYFKK